MTLPFSLTLSSPLDSLHGFLLSMFWVATWAAIKVPHGKERNFGFAFILLVLALCLFPVYWETIMPPASSPAQPSEVVIELSPTMASESEESEPNLNTASTTQTWNR